VSKLAKDRSQNSFQPPTLALSNEAIAERDRQVTSSSPFSTRSLRGANQISFRCVPLPQQVDQLNRQGKRYRIVVTAKPSEAVRVKLKRLIEVLDDRMTSQLKFITAQAAALPA